MKAVVIAAGSGSRLESRHNGIPKTLLRIGERTIIDTILDGIESSGIDNVVVITGYKAAVLEEYLRNKTSVSLNLQCIHNPSWRLSNGISVLSAEPAIEPGEEFVLLMSDHIFQREMLEMVVGTSIQKDQALLALDFKLKDIPDLDDGMKVRCSGAEGNRFAILELGKKLVDYRAIDCGMFKLNHSFFSVLRRSVDSGKTSLSDACNLLASSGRMVGVDIGQGRWIDLDTPEMFLFEDLINRITAGTTDFTEK